jgi:glycosyltransferase involved in cell wall biosynthesis
MSRFVLLTGRPDHPTDAVEDYCRLLGSALESQGAQVELAGVAWAEHGWIAALARLWKDCTRWRGACVLLQYTALAWSRRGFSLGFAAVASVLRLRGIRAVVVLHDPLGFPGRRMRDRVRRRVQTAGMRFASRVACKVISTIPIDKVRWLSSSRLRSKAVFIPVGSNVPGRCTGSEPARGRSPKVVVFGVTEGSEQEARLIAEVAGRAAAKAGPFRLFLLGRGAPDAEATVRQSLKGSSVRVEALGILAPEEVSETLAAADVELFVRGGVSSRRGSAIAGICCGLPLVAYEGSETGFPLTEAGVRLAPQGDQDALAAELARVLTDSGLRADLTRRSREAAARYFSWDAIARAFLAALPSERRS